MQPMSWEQFQLTAPDYSKAVAHPLEFIAAWGLQSATAVLLQASEHPWLLIEGEPTRLEYVQVLSACAALGHPDPEVAIPTKLARDLSLTEAERWFWLWRDEPLRSLPQGCEVIAPGEADAEIARFLQRAAPQSSTHPGHVELSFWVVNRSVEGEIAACAGGRQWRSGEAAVVSVAVAPDQRRQGLGSAVTQVAVSEWFARGARRVGLGVSGSNLGALAMYRAMGFERELDFTSFSLRVR